MTFPSASDADATGSGNSASATVPTTPSQQQSSIIPVVNLVYKGQVHALENAVTASTTGRELYGMALRRLELERHINMEGGDDQQDDANSRRRLDLIKLLYKGRRLDLRDDRTPVFVDRPKNNRAPKVMVMATPSDVVDELASKKSDPLIRGFQQEDDRRNKQGKQQEEGENHWGQPIVNSSHAKGISIGKQDGVYGFRKLVACTWQSFGWRASAGTTPHAFEAMRLLEKLGTDPGIVAVMRERELVVMTLGEMDPVDDRIMRKHQAKGSCLLGYNTNRGLRIDVKLRTDDLREFRPYPQLASTLLHELSHNWVGEHNLLFWTNYAQMRSEYLFEHRKLSRVPVEVRDGTNRTTATTTAELAGLDRTTLDDVYESVMGELAGEMRQHGLHPGAIAEPVRRRCVELRDEEVRWIQQRQESGGRRLGGGGGDDGDSSGGRGIPNAPSSSSSSSPQSKRQRALAAAEERARERRRQEQGQGERKEPS